MWKKVWTDPVWSKVISAGILAAIALVGSYLLNWWPAIGQYLAQGLAFARTESQIPNWLTGLLAVLSLPTLLVMLALAWHFVLTAKADAPSWQTYTSDNFFGLRWRWRYLRESLSDMHTFCPHCDFQVFPERASAFAAVDRISFHCESCDRALGTFDESYESLENKACRFVQQKLRNGTWQSQNGI